MTQEVSVARKALTAIILAVALFAAVVIQLTVVNPEHADAMADVALSACPGSPLGTVAHALAELVTPLEARAAGAFFVVQINRRSGDTITDPDKATRVEAGDGVVAVGRSAQAINALFAAPRQTARGGRF